MHAKKDKSEEISNIMLVSAGDVLFGGLKNFLYLQVH
jgi:hypothetical protein